METQDSDDLVHDCDLGSRLKLKGETTKDLELIFSSQIVVNFKKGGKVEKLKGCWCNICR